jgi:drug/metabolite transporter (DMT)-like permease
MAILPGFGASLGGDALGSIERCRCDETGVKAAVGAIGRRFPSCRRIPVPRPLSLISQNAYLLLLITMVFWAGNAIAGRLAVDDVSPLVLTWLRWTFGAVVLVLLARSHLSRDWPVICRHWRYIVFMGATGFAVFNALLYSALVHTTALNATILQAGIPMIIFSLNYLAFRTAVRSLQILGYSVTLVGVLVATSQGEIAQLLGLEFNRGDLIMLAGVLVYSTYSVALRAKPELHWLSFLAALFVVAAFVSLPLALYEMTVSAAIWPMSLTGVGVVLYTAIFPSIIGQALFIRCIELIGANAAGLFVNLVPIFGALLAVLILGERFQAYHAIALALVLGGIMVAQRRYQKPPVT